MQPGTLANVAHRTLGEKACASKDRAHASARTLANEPRKDPRRAGLIFIRARTRVPGTSRAHTFTSYSMRSINGHELLVGCPVKIEGLIQRPDLNGKGGTVVAIADSAGRCVIRLDGTTEDVTMRVRPANLLQLQGEPRLRWGRSGAEDRHLIHQVVGAAFNGDINSLRAGLDFAGIPVDVVDRDDTTKAPLTPLMAAAVCNNCEILRYLLRRGAAVDLAFELPSDPRYSMHTALAMAVSTLTPGRPPEAVAILLEAGADVNLADAQSFAPLAHAVERQHVEVVEMLLAAGADEMHQNFRGGTALIMAASKGDVRFVSLLRNPQATDLFDREGNTALAHASNGGHLEAMALLISRGAICDLVGDGFDGHTPLMLLAAEGSAAAASVLIAAGADLDLQTAISRSTALMLAMAHGNLDVLAVLVRGGASLTVIDATGSTAEERGQECNQFAAVQLLNELTAVQAGLEASASSQAGLEQSSVGSDEAHSDVELASRLQQASSWKERANANFRDGEISQALGEYITCLTFVPGNAPEHAALCQLACAVHCNIALCHIRIAERGEQALAPEARVVARQEWDEREALDAIAAAFVAAEVDCITFSGSPYQPWQMKSLLRRSQIYARLQCESPSSLASLYKPVSDNVVLQFRWPLCVISTTLFATHNRTLPVPQLS